jgi:methionyl-tRNA formyltransferase
MADSHKIVFMGSPEYAVPILQSLSEHFILSGVITQPDQPVGRGKVIQAPPVKEFAQSRWLPVFQPEKIGGEDFLELLKSLTPDAIVVAAYGRILPAAVLDYPKFGCINVHASRLPRWRGASPIHSAILEGDEKTGVTIMLMDEGVDTGPTLACSEVLIGPEDTTETLTRVLAEAGAELLIRTLKGYFEGKIAAIKQPGDGATYSRLLKKEDGRLDFTRDARFLERQVRACIPWPGAYLDWSGNRLRVWKASVLNGHVLKPGKRGVADKFPIVGTASTDLKLIEVQPAGKRILRGTDFLNGARNWLDE